MLNANEEKVLLTVIKDIWNMTRGEFGYSDEITVPGLNSHQIAGYLSQLVQKGFIDIDDEYQQVILLKPSTPYTKSYGQDIFVIGF